MGAQHTCTENEAVKITWYTVTITQQFSCTFYPPVLARQAAADTASPQLWSLDLYTVEPGLVHSAAVHCGVQSAWIRPHLAVQQLLTSDVN